jgi:hypothetical protein
MASDLLTTTAGVMAALVLGVGGPLALLLGILRRIG